MHVAWLKSLDSLLKVLFDRLGTFFKRKPKLYIHIVPGTSYWCIANAGAGTEWMQIRCDAHISNDRDDEDIIVIDVYLPKTKTQTWPYKEFRIPARSMRKEMVTAFVAPIIAQKGSDWTGKIILLDQRLKEHKSQTTTFKWAGPPAKQSPEETE